MYICYLDRIYDQCRKSRELELRYAEIMTGLKGEEALSKA